MSKNDYTCGFPDVMPTLNINESSRPFSEIKCADEEFIIPIIVNKNAEGSYRYPDKKLATVSTCVVPKAAVIHDAEGVKVCRDTYNVKAGKLYKNECVWFAQLTDEYIRNLGTIICDVDGEDDIPSEIHTFLEEEYDIISNGNDHIHGRPLSIKENPVKVIDGKIFVEEYNTRYTLGVFDVTIGKRTFETVGFINVQDSTVVMERYVDTNGRLVLMRWYESPESIDQTEWYTDEYKRSTANNPKLIVNGIEYRLLEDRISQYAL